MPYLNLDDNYADHTKVDNLSDAAFRLHTAALCHCAKQLTDGFVDDLKVERLVPRFKRPSLAELEKSGMWIRGDGGWWIHDYLQWNKPRSWWIAKRDRDAKRKAEWRAKHHDD